VSGKPSPAVAGPPDVLDSREAGAKVIRGGGLRVLAYAGGLAAGLVSVPLLSRHLGVREWGEYQTITSLIFVVAGITEGGIGLVGTREYAVRDALGRRTLIQDLLGLRLALTTVGALAAIGFVLVSGYDHRLIVGTVIACIGLYFTSAQVTLLLPLLGDLRLGWLALIDFFNQALLALLVVVLVAVGAGLVPFFAMAGVTSAVMLGMAVTLVTPAISPVPRFDPAVWRELLRETALYAASLVLATLYPKVAILAMSLLASKTETGLYALPMRVMDLVAYLPWLLVTTTFPILARAAASNRARLRYAQQRTFETMVLFGALVSLGLVLGAPFVIRVLGGREFSGSVNVLRIICFSAPFTFMAATWSFALLSLRAYRAMLLANALSLALAIVLAVLLIPPFGASGGAVINIAVEATLALGFAVGLARIRPELRPQPLIVVRVLAGFSAGLLAGLFVPGPSLVQAVVGLGVAGAALLALGAVPAELILEARRLVRR
jgi:O-antigen/teichoic acid export membrane protein